MRRVKRRTTMKVRPCPLIVCAGCREPIKWDRNQLALFADRDAWLKRANVEGCYCNLCDRHVLYSVVPLHDHLLLVADAGESETSSISLWSALTAQRILRIQFAAACVRLPCQNITILLSQKNPLVFSWTGVECST